MKPPPSRRPLKREGFRPCAELYVPSFRPFCGVSMRGCTRAEKCRRVDHKCWGFVDRGKGAGSPQRSVVTRAESVVEGTPRRGMAAEQSYPTLEALLKLEASLKEHLCGQQTGDEVRRVRACSPL